MRQFWCILWAILAIGAENSVRRHIDRGTPSMKAYVDKGFVLTHVRFTHGIDVMKETEGLEDLFSQILERKEGYEITHATTFISGTCYGKRKNKKEVKSGHLTLIGRIESEADLYSVWTVEVQWRGCRIGLWYLHSYPINKGKMGEGLVEEIRRELSTWKYAEIPNEYMEGIEHHPLEPEVFI